MSQTKQTDPLPQPLLPRFSTLWFFIAAVLVAIQLYIIRAAEQGQALAFASVYILAFGLVVAFLAGGCFMVSFLLGATELAIKGANEEVSSPFIDGSPPEQIIPPNHTEST